MSCYEWEYGQIVLPSADFARVRRAVQDADQQIKDEAFEVTQRVWSRLSRKERSDTDPYGAGLRRELQNEGSATSAAAQRQAEIALNRRAWNREWPARVKKTDMDFPTNRTTTFPADSDGTVHFERTSSTATWSVAENNHAVDHARSSPVWSALDRALSKTKWTPRTGGVIAGNDEYRSESVDVGGGANYTTGGYGPAGAGAGAVDEPYEDSKGRWWQPERYVGPHGFSNRVVQVTPARSQFGPTRFVPVPGAKPKDPCPPTRTRSAGRQGRVPPGMHEGGQFAPVHTGESDVLL